MHSIKCCIFLQFPRFPSQWFGMIWGFAMISYSCYLSIYSIYLETAFRKRLGFKQLNRFIIYNAQTRKAKFQNHHISSYHKIMKLRHRLPWLTALFFPLCLLRNMPKNQHVVDFEGLGMGSRLLLREYPKKAKTSDIPRMRLELMWGKMRTELHSPLLKR